ncbi:MAG: LLM class flavin-dependent oxidoreductase [Acidimicrobiales bacterium]|nr:LLM class flavin-dependent oxidoreductase [Acidimicrobiales bacterium]
MGLRIFTEPQQGASYGQLLSFARTAEEAGFDAFFRSDHYLKMGSASGLPAYTDAWTTLAALARDTTTIRLGTLVTPVTFRPIGTFPIIAAQVDHLSGGRLDVGLGAGWYKDEHDAYGLAFPSTDARYDLLEDQLEILHGLWTAEPGARFERKGRTCTVSIDADPLRPAQRPHPPVILGGLARSRNRELAARFADEFNVGFAPAATMKARHDAVRRQCEIHGRDPSSLVYSAALVICCGENDRDIRRRAASVDRDVDELRQNGLAGTPAEVLDKLGTYADHGVERFYLQMLDVLDNDHLRLVGEEVLPHAPGR